MIDLKQLEELARAATPQDFDSAEERREGGIVECPHCNGEGSVELEADYVNYDDAALGVQFYGIGNEHGAAEAFYRAANPAAVLELINLARKQEATLAAAPAQVAVPEGWVLVPKEPSPTMCRAARQVPVSVKPYPPHFHLIWDAMLSAAPQPAEAQKSYAHLPSEHWLNAASAAPAQPVADAAPVEAKPVELEGVQEQIAEGAGFWHPCSGCHETEDGHPVGHYPYSTVFKCQLGTGCSECGGIGAMWDNNDYEALANETEAAQPSPAQGDALSQQAADEPLHCAVPFEHAAQISTRKSYIAGFRAAEGLARQQGRAAGIEEAANLLDPKNPTDDWTPYAHVMAVRAVAIRALAAKPAEGGVK